MIETIGIGVFLAVLAYAAYSDLTSYQIPNWISLVIVADFVVTAAFGAPEFTTIAWNLGVGAAMLVAAFALFAAGVFGGGDAKLFAASSVWFGLAGLLKFVVFVALVGGLLALAILCLRRLAPPASWAEKSWLKKLHSRDQGVPYGIAIAVAASLMFFPLSLVAAFAGGMLSP